MPDDSTAQNPDSVAEFLQSVRGAAPLAIEQIETMLQLITAARGPDIRTFLDLGGDGLLTAAILHEHPGARGLLVDFSQPMLDAARRELLAHSRRVEFLETDFRQPGWIYSVTPCAPFDAVVSGFAIHHLSDTRKREIFREIFDLLAPDGVFINIEHVASPTRWTESPLDDYMIDAIFGRELKAARGKTRAQIARDYYTRAAGDATVLAPLEVQCDWLREIGFENIDCYLKVDELAVFGGQKPGGFTVAPGL